MSEPGSRTQPAAKQPQPTSQPPDEPDAARPGLRAVLRADLPFALGVLSLVGAAGPPLGLLWSRLAPPQLVLVLAGSSAAPLAGESEHRFDDMALFLLLGFAAGILAAAAVWLPRQRRGPFALLCVVAGAALAGWLAMRVGVAVAPSGPAVPPGHVTRVAPRLDSSSVLLGPPLGAALSYVLAAAWSSREDLGRGTAS